MARKSIVELTDQANADLPDNTTGLISAADVRGLFKEMLATLRPAYSQLLRTGGYSATVDVIPEIVAFAEAFDSYPAETTASLPGTIQMAAEGTTSIAFHCDVTAGNGISFTFELFKDGVTTDKRLTVTARGTANPVAASFGMLDYAATAATYTMQVSAESDGQAVTFSNIQLLASIQPVNSYV